MRPTVLLDTGPSGRLVIEEAGGEPKVRAEGELWRPVAALLSLAERDESAAASIQAKRDLERPEARIAPADPSHDLDAIGDAWGSSYGGDLSLCTVSSPSGPSVTLPREALADFLDIARQYRADIERYKAREATRAEIRAWVDTLPSFPRDPERLAALEAHFASGSEDSQARIDGTLAMHALGLLDGEDAETKRQQIAAYPALAARYEAALLAARYLSSEARRRALGEPVPLLASGVSLEWFLAGPYTAADLDPDEYLAFREASLFASDTLTDTSDATIYTNDLGPLDTVVYGSHNGKTRALLRAGQRVGGEVAVERMHPDVRLEEAAMKCLDAGAPDVALLLLPPLVERAPSRVSAADLLRRAREASDRAASPARAFAILREQQCLLAIPDQPSAALAPLVAEILTKGSPFEQRYALKRLRPFRDHPDVIAALLDLQRSGRSSELEPHFRAAAGELTDTTPPERPDRGDVPRGTSPVERLFGVEFWLAGVGSALFLIACYLYARYGR